MYRPFLLTGLIAAPLLASLSGCGGGGSTPVAQNTPAPVASAPAPTAESPTAMMPPQDSSGSGGSSEGSGMGDNYAQPSDDTSAGMGMGGMLGPPGMSEGSGANMSSMPVIGGNYPNGDPNMMMGSSEMGAGMGMGMGMGGMGMNGQVGQFKPPEDPAPDEDSDYLTKGRYAFSIGKEKEAIEYARAFAIASPDGVDVLQKTKWFAVGLRPVTTARFAVGVVLEAPATTTDFKPIGSKQLQGGGNSGASMMMGAPGSGAQTKATKVKEFPLYDLTGSFGEAVVSGFQERWSSGNFGTVYNDVEKFVPKLPVNNGMGMGGMAMGSGMGGMAGAPPGGFEGSGMGEMGMAMGSGMGGDGQTTPLAKIMPGSVVVPGMIYIGSFEKQAELLKKAEDRGVDLVFIFDVKVSPPNRLNKIVQNEAKVRIVSLKGDPLARSSELLNTEVERALMRASGDDEVAKATDKFFAQLDSKVKFTDMPALKPEHAKARLVQVLSNPNMGKLEKLFEVSLYHSMKLITDDEKLTACLIVMEGSEGESVANGRPEDKQAVLDSLLPNYK